MSEFVQLHNHTEYSLLDGMLRVSENHKPSKFLKGLAEQGIPAMAITDHGNMYGALDFYAAAQEAGIKPIIGCEFYITEGKYTEKDKSRTGHDPGKWNGRLRDHLRQRITKESNIRSKSRFWHKVCRDCRCRDLRQIGTFSRTDGDGRSVAAC